MSFQPISLVTEIEHYFNLAKDTNAALETLVTWADAAHTIIKKAPDAVLGLPSGTEWGEDTPTGLGDKTTAILSGPAADTQYSRFMAWRTPRKFILDKITFNIAMGHVVTYVAGSPNFTRFDITLRQFYNGTNKAVISPISLATGHSALAANGVQTYIFEESYTPNATIEQDAIVVLGVVMTVVAGSGGTARAEGVYPAFPYSKTANLKWWSQSGAYLQGRGLQ